MGNNQLPESEKIRSTQSYEPGVIFTEEPYVYVVNDEYIGKKKDVSFPDINCNERRFNDLISSMLYSRVVKLSNTVTIKALFNIELLTVLLYKEKWNNDKTRSASFIEITKQLRLSKLNHSYNPNTNPVFDEKKITLYATKKIQHNDELTMSYGFTANCYWNGNIEEHYFFKCGYETYCLECGKNDFSAENINIRNKFLQKLQNQLSEMDQCDDNGAQTFSEYQIKCINIMLTIYKAVVQICNTLVNALLLEFLNHLDQSIYHYYLDLVVIQIEEVVKQKKGDSGLMFMPIAEHFLFTKEYTKSSEYYHKEMIARILGGLNQLRGSLLANPIKQFYVLKPNYRKISSSLVASQAPHFEGKSVFNKQFCDLSTDSFKGKYLVLFFYPLDFTFVCPTEICAFSDRFKEFKDINCELVAVSTDSHFSHLA
ncbi:Alkyl hydroperoxide reductase protein C22 [Intoshia linei]|uniref:thioredoxin-dependent peroxiredoxin n=1 Tax=Intoshia linei TaxID=1819745 RepID=A0A177B583_9BILA|nr:Alkyl hydroperoxide reductase protein C22 [Intoshia linei]